MRKAISKLGVLRTLACNDPLPSLLRSEGSVFANTNLPLKGAGRLVETHVRVSSRVLSPRRGRRAKDSFDLNNPNYYEISVITQARARRNPRGQHARRSGNHALDDMYTN